MTSDQTKDTGLAMVLILLLCRLYWEERIFLLLAIACLVITMTWPGFFKPLARVWFGLSHVMGTVVSKILLTLVFYGVATPIGLLRRLTGADPMRVQQWRDGDQSVFVEKAHRFEAKDLEKPY
ncbi:MAG: SxtJ family membrane protein [Desulfobacterales bacterium]|nr:SxtJ family membrane protein [Desulfobacterales bacterium]